MDVFVRVILTDRRLILLEIPLLRRSGGLTARLRERRLPQFLRDALGRWRIRLDSPWASLDRPSLSAVPLPAHAGVPYDLALIVGGRHFWIGPPACAREIAEVIGLEWSSQHPDGR